MNINLNGVPQEMRDLKSWVLWKLISRDGKPTKVPFQVNGSPAKSNDPTTWSDFESCCERMDGYEGIGFMFAESDPYCGIDLDGCRDPKTGIVSPWAKEIILKLSSYAEVSPSETGVKILVRGVWTGHGHKMEIENVERIGEKIPAIEVYDRLRYFAVTGVRLKGMTAIAERQKELNELHEKFWKTIAPATYEPQRDFRDVKSVVDRARSYLTKLPYAISGSDGHGRTYHAACVLCVGFGLSADDAMSLLLEWNQGCSPPWSERELNHKINCAMKEGGDRNYLRNVEPKNFDRVSVPIYPEPEVKPEPKIIMLHNAASSYLSKLKEGGQQFVETGIPELDYAIGGGAEYGELFLMAARPSHGKSMCGLQMIHHWTSQGIPSAFISEEMSSRALGKRTVQYASEIHQEHWGVKMAELESDLDTHFRNRAPCVIVEQCRTAEAAVDAIKMAKNEHGVKCVVVDYAQLLQSKGKSRYEQVTNTSIALRQVANETGVLLVALCQLGRDIEKRTPMIPHPSDLKDSGQLEQDADVIVFLVWPHRLDTSNDAKLFQFFVGKNRNRETNEYAIECQFEPSRQRLVPTKTTGVGSPVYDPSDQFD